MDYRNVIRNPNLVPCTYNNLTIFHYRRGHLKDIHSVVLGSGITAKGIRQEKHSSILYTTRENFFTAWEMLLHLIYEALVGLTKVKYTPEY